MERFVPFNFENKRKICILEFCGENFQNITMKVIELASVLGGNLCESKIIHQREQGNLSFFLTPPSVRDIYFKSVWRI